MILKFCMCSDNWKLDTVAKNFNRLSEKANEWANLSLYSLYYVKARNEFVGPIFPSLRLRDNIAPSEEMWQRGVAVGNALSSLTDQRFEPQVSWLKDIYVTARPNEYNKLKHDE